MTNQKRENIVLSRDDAFHLLSNVHESYFSAPVVNDRRLPVIIAEEAAKEGLHQLADAIISIDECMLEFKKGNFAKIEFLAECPIAEEMVQYSKNTKFEKAVESFASAPQKINDMLIRMTNGESPIGPYKNIDWKASSKILGAVKAERFPAALSMVEKLSQWQQGNKAAKGK